MQHSAILSTFIKLPFAIKIFVLSNFEWPFYTGFTVLKNACMINNQLISCLFTMYLCDLNGIKVIVIARLTAITTSLNEVWGGELFKIR